MPLPVELRSCLYYSRRSFWLSLRYGPSRNFSTPALRSPSGGKDKDFVPKPLSRPLGLDYPPQPGQNTGIDPRTWRQRRDDFVNYDKHLERRKQLTRQVSKPYFRDWTNMRFSRGKSFISNTQLFRQDKALYFPNLQGVTLASPRVPEDTTRVLEGKISIVSVFCSQWAEEQVATFVSKEQNPSLHEALGEGVGLSQLVDINIEENAMKASIIRLFMPRLRRRIPMDRHGQYFVVRHGINEDIRNATGLLNVYVGYVYLLDSECKIRWAGSGIAAEDERQGLVRGVRRLTGNWKKVDSITANSKQDPLEKAAEAVAAASA
ncbi:MAG: hypothetical protein M1812_001840 [Candelaria pacifica]|nr:MAG: hypothetical protein M1812_001840 [Candelaria pacifica]